MTVLYENDAFSILVLSTKKPSSIFSKRFSFSRKSISKLKYWKRSKFPLTVTLKHADPSNAGLFGKSLVPFIRRTYPLSVGFKMKPLRKNVFQCEDKTNPNFAIKLAENSNHSFIAVYLMNYIFQTSVLFNT